MSRCAAAVSLCLFLMAVPHANAEEAGSWFIKIDCCKSNGCYVADRFRFERQSSRAKLFSSKNEAQEFLKKMSVRLKRQNPRVLNKK